ncbi:NAD-dependent epimerase/dehydratase family protein [Draconibacterium halophilum]|uniref:NAD-dependent epimerase/dehydratase family protein n=1 Tax=Draconibacterium halophilum TaxID=2706887 RepID=UPI00293BA204|nr:NAD-dependent epimerase/dehydratase family protein [Draconibacterium halophilum]
MNKEAKIYIAGHRGLVGSAIWKNFQSKGYTNLIGRTFEELDLMNQQAVADFFEQEKPDYVVLAAAKVGGIIANSTYRGQFIYENLQIQNNVIHQAYVHGVKKLLFLGSTCIYPKQAPQPMPENCLLTDTLEYTNEPYAIAKIAGLKMCESYNLQYGTNFISVMPTNLYGPNDNFDLEKSHVLPAMVRKIHLAKCLEDNNWEAICEDLNRRPVEGINGDAEKKEILAMLSKYGLKMNDKLADIPPQSHHLKVPQSQNLTVSPSQSLSVQSLKVSALTITMSLSNSGEPASPCASSCGRKTWPMPVFFLWKTVILKMLRQHVKKK